MFKKLLLTTLLGFSFSAFAGELEDLIAKAEKGDVDAQFNLGVKYEFAKGVKKDMKKAAYWYQKAANQGDSSAQNNLGVFYENGRGGLPQDNQKAVEWYLKSAEQGDEWGQWNLGLMYVNGKGVTQDYIKAREWLQKSANQNHAEAQYNLGVLYYEGFGVTKDITKAAEWYQKAAEQNHKEAQNNLGVIYFYIWDDKEKGLELFVQACKNGNDMGCENQDRWTLDLIDPKTVQKAKAGDASSMISIANKLAPYDMRLNTSLDSSNWGSNKQEPIQNETLALEWYHKAFNTGEVSSFAKKLAELEGRRAIPYGTRELFKYYDGKKDYDNAFFYLEKMDDKEKLADYHFYGKGTEQDFLKAALIYSEVSATNSGGCISDFCRKAFLFSGFSTRLIKINELSDLEKAENDEDLSPYYWQYFNGGKVSSLTESKLIERAEKLLKNETSSSIFDFFKSKENSKFDAKTELFYLGLTISGANGFKYVKASADLGHTTAQYATSLAYKEFETGYTYSKSILGLKAIKNIADFKKYAKLACEGGLDAACSEYNRWENGYNTYLKMKERCKTNEYACSNVSDYQKYEKWVNY